MPKNFELKPTSNVAKDFLGKEIKVGDEVVFCQVGYREFRRAFIMKITPKTVFLSYKNKPESSNWHRQLHEQVVKL